MSATPQKLTIKQEIKQRKQPLESESLEKSTIFAAHKRLETLSRHEGAKHEKDSHSTDMYWTLELASKLEDAPWPASQDELIDYAMRSGAPMEVVENLQELEDEGELYETIEDVWPDYPTKEDFLFNEDEY